MNFTARPLTSGCFSSPARQLGRRSTSRRINLSRLNRLVSTTSFTAAPIQSFPSSNSNNKNEDPRNDFIRSSVNSDHFVQGRRNIDSSNNTIVEQQQQHQRTQDVLRALFSGNNHFEPRHIGTCPNSQEAREMLKVLGFDSMDDFISKAVPESIRFRGDLLIGDALTEQELIQRALQLASQNQVRHSYIGMGYYNCITPSVIQRCLFENPGWYTQYTPYQAEIAQGRLESLFNFQTMITSLMSLPISNASLLDEATAVAEAMSMAARQHKNSRKKFILHKKLHPQSIAVAQTRAQPLGFEVQVSAFEDMKFSGSDIAALVVQYPDTNGGVYDITEVIAEAKRYGTLVICATDLLACTLLKPPGELGFDIAVGSAQRFGVPLGYGGPHAAFLACTDELKRIIPGRIVGQTRDAQGRPTFRLALQTREQHIRRDKATSNICTAQALLANMSAMYAVYHGAKGLQKIALKVHGAAALLAHGLQINGYSLKDVHFFDTIKIRTNEQRTAEIKERARMNMVNLRYFDNGAIGVSLDETITTAKLDTLLQIFDCRNPADGRLLTCAAIIEQHSDLTKSPSASAMFDRTAPSTSVAELHTLVESFPNAMVGRHRNLPFQRTSQFLEHPVFNQCRSETQLMRYMKELENKDLSLVHGMIPLGSCTMKLNAATEMLMTSWPQFSALHPFAPASQAQGYEQLFSELEYDLCRITGYDAFSFQPNSGAQGEYAGLLAIMGYLKSVGQHQRKICLIPTSAHGTNPASAVMAGMQVVAIKCRNDGSIDHEDLDKKLAKHGKELAAIMVTYPSVNGVFDTDIKYVCMKIHAAGGQVYMDGANMNAMVGIARPADLGSDVSHLNLHKTFCIPHGGGGPGMGPIGVKEHLRAFLPAHPLTRLTSDMQAGPVSAAPWGSASILPISWSYIKMMGSHGLRRATETAILNANYMAKRLEPHYKVLFKGGNGFVAHEFIIDARPFKSAGIEATDIAKRLQDYCFHAPTLSWPVVGCLMIEPTESEDRRELDRLVSALISIRQEIDDIQHGRIDKDDNMLRNAPHTQQNVFMDEWTHPYSREQAAFPNSLRPSMKLWPTSSRVDDVYGDQVLICSCPPVQEHSQP